MASEHPRLDALKKHLRGARRRLLWVLVSFGLGASLSWYYRAAILGWLIAPAHGHLSPTGPPIFTGITDAFGFATQLAILGGVLAATPVAAFHVFRLLNPFLGRTARRFLLILLPAALVLFIVGMAFSYFLVLPLVLNFMLGFAVGVAVPMIGLDEYMNEVKIMLLGMGLVFETPLVMFLLAKFQILSHEQMKKVRRFVPPMAFIFAGFISNTIEISIPIAMTALFELGLFLAWLTERDSRRTAWRVIALSGTVLVLGLATAGWWLLRANPVRH